MALGLSGAALLLAACGGTGEPAAGFAMGKALPAGQDSSKSMSAPQATMPTLHNESEFRVDPDCPGQVPPGYGAIIENTIHRFNTAYPPVASWGKVEFLGATRTYGERAKEIPYHNAVVMACGSGDVFAFSHGQEVSVSLGLLSILEESAGKHKDSDPSAGLSQYQPATLSGPVEQGNLFESAMAFIIYHELGHIYLGHTIPADGQLQGSAQCCMEEIQADLFAATALRKTGYSMDGANLVFEFLERTNPDGSPAHPGARLRSSMVAATP
ncbi:MAG: M48 family metalloprotease [Nitrospinota bacterium]|nr:M48 family metalloprotease [Nitrospinota bacterium]